MRICGFQKIGLWWSHDHQHQTIIDSLGKVKHNDNVRNGG